MKNHKIDQTEVSGMIFIRPISQFRRIEMPVKTVFIVWMLTVLILLFSRSPLITFSQTTTYISTTKHLGKAQYLSDEIEYQSNNEGQCLLDPSFDFDGRFVSTCGWWIDSISSWKEKLQEQKYTIKFYAYQERSGTGDRLAGVMGSLYHAMQRNERLEVQWALIDQSFKTSCLVNDSQVKLLGTRPKRFNAYPCSNKAYYSCSYANHVNDNCPIYNRACMNRKPCTKLVDSVGKSEVSMKHVIGCPLRAIMQVKETMFDHEISWFNRGSTVNGSLGDLIAEMSEFNVIAIHLRLGDKYLMEDSKVGQPESLSEKYTLDNTMKCKSAVLNTFNNNKQTKFLIASDNHAVKSHFMEMFPNEVIVLKAKPHHITIIRRESEETKIKEEKDLFAEWLAISRADELITNRAHRFGISAFSRSAWLYSLRSSYYEVSRKKETDEQLCKRKEFEYKGNSLTIDKTCNGDAKSRNITQPHLLK